MIDIALLTEKDIGRWVWYIPDFGGREKGKLKSWNRIYVFVVFQCDGVWNKFCFYTAESVAPDDLEFIVHESHCRADIGFVCACVSCKTILSDL